MFQLLGGVVGAKEPLHPLWLVVIHVQVGSAHMGFPEGHRVVALLVEVQGLELFEPVALHICLAAFQHSLESVGKAHAWLDHSKFWVMSEGLLNLSEDTRLTGLLARSHSNLTKRKRLWLNYFSCLLHPIATSWHAGTAEERRRQAAAT